ncbi:MAG: hypothetical protein KF729_39240, partial [Sandaracinaceae bacterium]|nr:hypothetical protein [Sandaracinaceae bacterium]
ALGGVALLAGAILGAVALNDGNALRDACGGSTCPEPQRERAESVTILSNTTDGLLIGGALVAAAGLVITLLVRDGAETPLPQAGFACDFSGCAASMGGTF